MTIGFVYWLMLLLWLLLGTPLPRIHRGEQVPIALTCSPSVSWTFLPLEHPRTR